MEHERSSVVEERQRVEAAKRAEEEERQPSRGAKGAAAGTSSMVGIGGAGAAVLGILGLVNVVPGWLMPIAIIAVGAALLSLGGAAAGGAAASESREAQAAAGAMSMQTLFGVGGVTLGILALVGVATGTLVPIASLVFGAAFLMSASATGGMASQAGGAAAGAMSAASGMQIIAGLAGIVLGIIALSAPDAGTVLDLTLISHIGFGTALLLASGAIAGGAAKSFR